MPRKLFIAILLIIIACPGLLWAQVFFPQKDLAFAQVAVGGGYETVINVVNRGPADYYGKIYFWKNSGEVWNPIVVADGDQLTNGNLFLGQGQATTLRLTSSGQTQVGFVYIASDNLTQDNFIEGNLTYNILNGSGGLIDSVGIGPSVEFYLATIPFDDFSSVALALANPAPPGQNKSPASVSLKLYNNNNLVDTAVVTLEKNSHSPNFLSNLFLQDKTKGLTKGWVVIQSEQPVIATALTVKQGQFNLQMSSLPVQPAPVSYRVDYSTTTGFSASGKMSLWAEGRFVKGYMRIITVNGSSLYNPDGEEDFSFSGRLSNQKLFLSIDSGDIARESFNNKTGVLSVTFSSFSFSSGSVSSTFWFLSTSDSSISVGDMTLTRLN